MDSNKQLARELFARISGGDVEGALATLADDATWWIAGKRETQPAAGEHDKAWVARLLRRMEGALEAPMPMAVKGMVAEGDKVAVEVVGDGRLRDGRRYQNEYHFVLTVRDGKIVAVREYLDTQHVVATWFAPPPDVAAPASATAG
jgi:ketosteroid isomerase-like protein